jgi:hypothetical protein
VFIRMKRRSFFSGAELALAIRLSLMAQIFLTQVWFVRNVKEYSLTNH